MTTTDERPWEPPLAGTEVQQLFGALDRLRWTFRYKASGLDAAGLAHRVGRSSLTLGGLLKHLAAQEDYASGVKLTGVGMGREWADHGWDGDDEWEFRSAADDSPATLYSLYDGAVARARTRWADALSDGGLDRPADPGWAEGRRINARRLLCDLVEEYGRHTGQADLLREDVDGVVGEDPPDGWRP
ncbi:DUF664 domain-containing protein [Nocardioides cynanchi]|uniref:mycothiol transferase n=1 Tax=Nocardioides cynanchi TaxID=2558918 RepID=UPI0012481936|nr:DUF664 domain-containing protein [Nocardioides cynanchi]